MADKTLKQNESYVGLFKDIGSLSSGTLAKIVGVVGFKTDGTPILLPLNDAGRLIVSSDAFNGVEYEPVRNNHEVVVLESAARTADTTSADQVNYNARGVALFLDVTATGTPAGQIDALNVQAKVGSGYVTIYSFTSLTINTVGQYPFLIYPFAVTAGTWKATPIQGVVPRNWRLNVDHASADSITYSVVASYLV